MKLNTSTGLLKLGKLAGLSKGMSVVAGGLLGFLLFVDSGFTPDIIKEKKEDIDDVYSMIARAIKDDFVDELEQSYLVIINQINNEYGDEYGCEITTNFDDEDQVYVPRDGDGSHSNSDGYIKYEGNKCHVNLETKVTPTIDELSKMIAINYSTLNDQMSTMPYGVLVGDRTLTKYDHNSFKSEDSTKYDSIHSKGESDPKSFEYEINHTEHMLDTYKDIEYLGYDDFEIEKKEVVIKEAGCEMRPVQPVDDGESTIVNNPASPGNPAQPNEEEYCWEEETEEHIFISGRFGSLDSCVEVERIVKTDKGWETVYNVECPVNTHERYMRVFPNFNDIRKEEIENMISYQTEISTSRDYYELKDKSDELRAYKFVNTIHMLELEDVFARVLLGSPYGSAIWSITPGAIISGQLEELAAILGMSVSEMLAEIHSLAEQGLISGGGVNGKGPLQCAALANYLIYKTTGLVHQAVNGINYASTMISAHGWKNALAPGGIFSRPALSSYQGANKYAGHVGFILSYDGHTGKMLVAEANLDSHGTITIKEYTYDKNTNTMKNSSGTVYSGLQFAAP